jgi:hypothetical protein
MTTALPVLDMLADFNPGHQAPWQGPSAGVT